MPKQIRLNAFDMNCVAHQSPGLWTHPRDRADSYNTLDYWVELAKLLERGKFDALFLADVLGVYDVYRGSPDAAVAQAVQVPVNDPLLLIPAMAYVTRDLGFGVTCAVSYEHPYTLARRFSTLDHLTGGRIGWNIVTGYLNSAAKGMGLARQPEHDARYEIAEEYMEVVYKLWEASWQDDAVLRDRARGVFARPEKVHRIRHDGTYFQLEAIHLCEPSPQRTPLLYQAGASTRGRQFAATHAECVFINGPSKQVIAHIVADIRRRAVAVGRNPEEILIFNMMTVITAPTSAAAKAKLDDYRSYISEEGALVLMSGWTGIDFSELALDEPLRYSRPDAQTSALEAFTIADPDRVWTVREIAKHAAIGGRGPVVVGSPEQVADELIGWVEETGVDGFNLAYAVTPETFEDFVDLVVPELQKRGRYKLDYAPGTLREKLYGPGRARLRADHPAARFR
ncbi:MAG: LLM class flavin-dependent oxidoreductase [Acetobacteraceae bacterium]|nr:LLM class flavin-dependent oxidoreductase [Acetobacteraceae bacterium]